MELFGINQLVLVFVLYHILISIFLINVYLAPLLFSLISLHFYVHLAQLICITTHIYNNVYGVLYHISLIVSKIDANALSNLHINTIKPVYLAPYLHFGMKQLIFANLVQIYLIILIEIIVNALFQRLFGTLNRINAHNA
jgi:hypothetical protein